MSYKEEIVESLTQRKKILESTVKRAEMDLNQSIKGHIEVCNIRNHYRYYYKAPKGENDGKREYTRDIAYAKQIQLARKLHSVYRCRFFAIWDIRFFRFRQSF